MNVWRKIDIEGETYVFKYSNQNSVFIIYISDFINLWFQEINNTDLLKRTRDLNDHIEAEDESFLKKITTMLNTIDKIVIKLNDEKLTLNSKDLRFQVEFNLKSANSQMFFLHITSKLLHSINSLNNRQNQLMNIIDQKDLEINEYRLQGASLIRECMATLKFNKEGFLTNPFNDSKTLDKKDLCTVFTSL